MANCETDFDFGETNSVEIHPYQFEPVAQTSSANIRTETSNSDDVSENGDVEEEHSSERVGNTDW